MKKLTKLLLPSVAIMLVAVMALTGATYAWFQNSTEADFAQIETSVVSADGLVVSWNGEDWMSYLEFDDTYSAVTTNTNFKAENWAFAPVSSHIKAYDAANGVLKMFSATVENDKIIDINAADGGYIKFDLYVRLDSANTVKVDQLDISSKIGERDSIGIASRVAMVYHGTEETNNPASFKIQKASSLTYGDNFFLFEPNSKMHTSEGLKNQNKIDTSKTYVSSDIFPYVGMYDAVNNVDYALGAVNDQMAKVENVEYAIDGMQFELPKGYSKFSVYVWVEGQDADCLNDLGGTGITVQLGLAKVEE